MNQATITLCKDNNIDLCVFNMSVDGNIIKHVMANDIWNNNLRRKINDKYDFDDTNEE